MKIKTILISLFAAVILVSTLMLYVLSRDNVESLIVCSVDEKSSYIPASICAYYLFKYRGDKDDIEYLSSQAGLGFMVNIEDRKMRQTLMNHFLAKGIDVNGISNIDGLTPLHAAVLLNDHQLVRYLLDKGADPNKTDRDNHLNVLQFLKLLEQKDPSTDRSKIESQLKLVSNK